MTQIFFFAGTRIFPRFFLPFFARRSNSTLEFLSQKKRRGKTRQSAACAAQGFGPQIRQILRLRV